MVEGAEPVLAAQDEQRRTAEPAGEDFRKGFAHPIQSRRAGVVLKGQDQQHLAGAGLLTLLAGAHEN